MKQNRQRKTMRFGIRTKILIIFVAMLITTGVINLYIIGQILKKDYRSTLHSELLILGSHLQTQLRRITSLGISTQDIEGFSQQCRELVDKNKHIVRAMIIDAEGTIIFHNDPFYLERKLTQKEIIASIPEGTNRIFSTNEKNMSMYCAVLPFGDNPDYFGYAVVVCSPANIANTKVMTLINKCNAVLVISFGLAAVLLLFSLTKILTSPLAVILKTMEDITESRDLDRRVDIKTHDEIGQIASAFNTMTADLKNTTTSIDNLNHEIAERKKAQEAMKQLNRDLESTVAKVEEANDNLKKFVYIASHDLREPLRKVASFGALLKNSIIDKISEDDVENLNFMVDGAKRMSQMIEGLLSYSRVSTKGLPSKTVDLNEVIKQLREIELSILIEEKNVTLEIPQELPSVNADPVQLRQLLQNLIANGVKYQPQGSTPQITITSRPADDGMVRIEVTDNGIGIQPENRTAVFEMFKRLHSRGEYEGTGIGLAVCKKIVERHGGRIGVESEYGKGSTFWFTVPAANLVTC